jgi:hypothetical protein
LSTYAKIVLGLGVALIALSLIFSDGKGPADWLIEWTSWATRDVSLAVAAHAVLKLTRSLESWVKWRTGTG